VSKAIACVEAPPEEVEGGASATILVALGSVDLHTSLEIGPWRSSRSTLDSWKAVGTKGDSAWCLPPSAHCLPPPPSSHLALCLQRLDPLNRIQDLGDAQSIMTIHDNDLPLCNDFAAHEELNRVQDLLI